MAIIESLYTYPVKSMKGQGAESLNLKGRGPQGDRRFMVVQDRSGHPGAFLTQRDKGCEILARIRPEYHDGGLKMTAPDGTTLDLTIPGADEKLYTTRVFKDPVEVQDCSAEAARFLTSILGQPARLVYQPENAKRFASPKYARPDDRVSLADGFALLITNRASLENLNSHIPEDERVSMDRFRPNIVLSGIEPFEEDVIKSLKIGTVELEIVKPCTRCKVTTIDQVKGVSAGKEPLATLSKLRRGRDDKLSGVFFGVNAQIRVPGIINLGDKVKITQRSSPPEAVRQAKVNYI